MAKYAFTTGNWEGQSLFSLRNYRATHYTSLRDVRSSFLRFHVRVQEHQNNEKVHIILSIFLQAVPPIYDLGAVNVPMYLYYGDRDWLATSADVENSILPSLKQDCLKATVKLTDFNHIDFVWGSRAADEVYKPIVDTIKNPMNQNE